MKNKNNFKKVINDYSLLSQGHMKEEIFVKMYENGGNIVGSNSSNNSLEDAFVDMSWLY